jgi:hypothetical protein
MADERIQAGCECHFGSDPADSVWKNFPTVSKSTLLSKHITGNIMNIRFEYLYRDAGNNKRWGEVVFANQQGLDVNVIMAYIADRLIDGHFFEIHELDIPPLRFETYDGELDHDWHEFSACMNTGDEVTDSQCRDISEFMKSFDMAAQQWRQYT